MGTETPLMRRIQLAVGKLRHVRLFRNNVGVAVYRNKDGSACRVVYGLAPGSSDLVGWTSILVRPEHVGRRLAVFTALEVKTLRGGKGRDNQLNFIDAVRDAGGIADIVRDPEAAVRLVEGAEG